MSVIMTEKGMHGVLPTIQCSCRGADNLFKFDQDIWSQTVKDCLFQPPQVRSAEVNAAACDDTSSEESIEIEQAVPGFIDLVTNRRPSEPRWFHRFRSGKREAEDDDNYAFCLNLADVQRMHLRLLQGRLTWLALSAGFDADHGASQGVLTELGPTLRDYGSRPT